ncbi:MAG: TVP38/TMEM64 family protein [Gammaproteobacteria bacterium]
MYDILCSLPVTLCLSHISSTVDSENKQHNSNVHIWLGMALLLAMLAGAAMLVSILNLPAAMQPERLSAWIESTGMAGPAMLMLLMFIAVVIGPIPTIPITVTSGLVYGFVAGFLLSMFSALAGALAAFWLGRWLGRSAVAHLMSGHISFCADCSNKMLFRIVLATRLIPLVSFALVSYGAGLTAMTARVFMLATAIGMIPMTAVYVGIGSTLVAEPVWAGIGGMMAVVLMLGLPRLLEYGYLPGMRIPRCPKLTRSGNSKTDHIA